MAINPVAVFTYTPVPVELYWHDCCEESLFVK